MSIGNATQAVDFNRDDLTLVLGENLDLGSNGSRNGTGKTTLINALSYGLYGSALSDIKVNNLINKTNAANMLVSVEFDIDQTQYRIERGRKPNVLKFYKDNKEQKADDEAQGDGRETQKEIASLLGISHDMFKHAIALNTYTTPFLSMKAGEQKNIIEELLGITVLTEKAEALKAINKTAKDQIKEEEFRLSAVIKANEHIEEQIEGLERRQRMWQRKKDETVGDHVAAIEKLMELDIEDEITKHKNNADKRVETDKVNAKGQAEVDKFNAELKLQSDKDKAAVDKFNSAVLECNRWIKQITSDSTTQERRSQSIQKDIDLLADHKCHSCGQELHDSKQEENIAAKEKELLECSEQLILNEGRIEEHKLTLAELGSPPEVQGMKVEPRTFSPERYKGNTTFYKTIDEAHGHKSSLETLSSQLETALADEDPYIDQINDMKDKGMQDVDYDEMNRLVDLQEHQAFLLKLLTSKDSFIRKKIIEQNLAYLNNRLTHYLREIGLPHLVRFMSDLSVEITDMGRELDFDNLSRGERNRLILSLSWAFRDVWESLYNHINLLFVDELVDNGLDSNGVEAAIKIMKGMARERGKSVWLVSHRDELISRVNNTMKVVKEGGFTNYEGAVE